MPPDKLENRLLALETFTVVARLLSFNAAAEELGISASALSRRISQLEESLGTRLFQRTTRQVSLTEAGTVYLRFVNEALAHIADGQAAISDFASEPSGRLRVSLPNLFGQLQVAPRLSDFIKRYPRMMLDLSFSDQYVDLVSEGFDLAIRIGILQESGLIARKLGDNLRVLCASPAYIKEYGKPKSPDDLVQHACLQFRTLESQHHWQLQRGSENYDVSIKPVVIADNAEALRKLALSGTGIALLATFVISDDLQSGRLERVLPQWSGPESSIWAVYPSGRFLPLKVRVFIDYLVEQFGKGFTI